MRWRPGVRIEYGDDIWLNSGNKRKRVEKEDENIILLMESGITEDDELIRRVTADLDGDDIGAGFRLAQFVEDYGEFLAEGKKSAIFGI
ncbi:MAG: hypothetical protein K5894_10410 [Lachnospiraceae bacterium]|nr:hypothetical protein [Lachnospiraceae bacterium]MDN4745080.1 hypothetical protein [Lachnospiraceae bacterium C1.1]